MKSVIVSQWVYDIEGPFTGWSIIKKKPINSNLVLWSRKCMQLLILHTVWFDSPHHHFLLLREVITIQKFLEAAARQETCGKVRIQHFIENLLRRIALAERLVEYYQANGSPPQCNHYKVPLHTSGPNRWPFAGFTGNTETDIKIS